MTKTHSTRALAATLAAIALLALLAGCRPTRREPYEVMLRMTNVTLTNAQPQAFARFRLEDDPGFADRRDDLHSLDEMRFEISVPRNTSSRLRLGVYVSDKPISRLIEATKIADFNLAAGETVAQRTNVRVFNQFALRNTVLGDEFFVYLSASADRIDLTVGEAVLVVRAQIVN
jgi:hypothetical protein